ncbi:scarecrow-like protein 6 [Punica granatum]|uniref:Scarecrow-like protein 6 n=1 Tax=Punica granatum TaxID=22663 RepID=A0A6P8D4J9_PUNGR|nr:scarecrow-like protein 6 [Punica granatum]
MKATPLLFEEFQGKGLLDFSSSSSPSATTTCSNSQLNYNHSNLSTAVTTAATTPPTKGKLYVGSPSPSPPAAASSSTLSSSLNSGDILGGGGSGRCGGGMGAEEDWEAVLPETAASPGHEQSILRLIMGDIEDPSLGLSKLLHSSSAPQDMEFGGGGFGFMDPQALTFDGPNLMMGGPNSSIDPASLQDLPLTNATSNLRHVSPFPLFTDSVHSTVMPFPLPPGVIQQPHNESMDEKPQIFNPQLIINQNQVQFPQNPSLVPLGFNAVQDHPLSSSGPPLPKRLNPGPVGSNFVGPRGNFPNSGQSHNHHHHPQHHQFQQRPAMVMKQHQQKVAGEELANHQLQQAITDHLYKAAELIETGNPVLAQGILARLNHHQLSPVGKPFRRAAFYCKEALQSLLHHHHPHLVGPANPPQPPLPPLPPPPFGIIYKIGAYKSFCEISPVVQFANFTCNQAFLEALEGFSRIHILSFEVGFGGEWASLMQELVLRNGGPPSLLRITVFASPGTHDELELGLTQDTLKHFAHELNMALEFEVVSIESFNSAINLPSDGGEAIAVYLPIGSFSSYPSYLPAAVRFIKQLSPKIVVSLDRGCDRSDTPFPNHMIHALQCYSSLLESLDAVNVNLDVLQKIERYLIQPGIERIVNGRQRSPEKMIAWRSLFLSCGFSPLTFSNFNESQAECLVQRSLARGFHVEKRQSSLVLCWHRKELVSASAWRC